MAPHDHAARPRAFWWALALLPAIAHVASAETIWSGLSTTFTKADGTSPLLPANQDRITDNVYFTRNSFGQGLLNAKTECTGTGCSYTHELSPQGTEWATDLVAGNSAQTIAATNWQDLTFIDWEGAYGDQVGLYIVGRDAVVHLIVDDIYLDLRFTAWTPSGGGGFSYQRATGPSVPEPAALTLPLGCLVVLACRFRSRPE